MLINQDATGTYQPGNQEPGNNPRTKLIRLHISFVSAYLFKVIPRYDQEYNASHRGSAVHMCGICTGLHGSRLAGREREGLSLPLCLPSIQKGSPAFELPKHTHSLPSLSFFYEPNILFPLTAFEHTFYLHSL